MLAHQFQVSTKKHVLLSHLSRLDFLSDDRAPSQLIIHPLITTVRLAFFFSQDRVICQMSLYKMFTYGEYHTLLPFVAEWYVQY